MEVFTMTTENIPSGGETEDGQLFKMVGHSYDKMGERYHRFRNNEKFIGELEQFVGLLPPSGDVLDAGCGVGKPTSEYLAKQGFKVTGVDISGRMIELAKQNVPDVKFHQKNILELDFPNNAFDGIICVYTLWHIPREHHANIIENFHRMLKDDGILVLNTGVYESDGMSRFFGEPMLWSTNDPKKTLGVVKSLGFEILQEGILNLGGERQYWIFAKKK
ncbi:MAG: methyltransferase domain-containing protein [Candidatus Lokiarchaeota archaeon]|nr:methyltransferase domain-containing protein [Candidatus Lokiarchaeota archaeon]